MTFVIAAPEMIASAASDLSRIRSMIAAADAAAATSTTTVIAAAGDEVSAAIASLFSSNGRAYQS
ncbi:MAG: PE family protein, partial [Mycobacterium sp.]